MRGSMLGGDIYSTKNGRTADMVAAMLTREQRTCQSLRLAKSLSAGARLSFFNGQARVGFSGKFLSEDTNMVVGLLADQLQNPLLLKKSLKRQRKTNSGI